MSIAPDAILERLLKGEAVDAAAAVIPSAGLTRLLLALAQSVSGPTTISLSNASLDGDLLLDGIGERGRPLALQLERCDIRGTFRARSSRWRQLVVARSDVHAIDVPRCHVIGEVSFEGARSKGWLEARGCEFEGALLLNEAAFNKGDRAKAIVLADTRVGLSVSAHRLNVDGGINASRIRVGGFFRLDGSRITGTDGFALVLSDAVVGGEIGLAQSAGRSFHANGAVNLASCAVGGVEMTAAHIEADAGPALILDHARINGALDLSGADARHRFQAKGGVRMVAAHVAFQFQAINADISAREGPALTCDSAEFLRDVVLGHERGDFVAEGDVTINNAKIGGRVLLSRATLKGRDSAFALRQSDLASEVAIYECFTAGAVRMDNTKAWGLSVKGLSIERALPRPDLTGLPEGYAHEADVLFDISAAHIASDVHIERLTIEGGDCRLINAHVVGGMMLTAVRVHGMHGYAIVAQGAKIGSFSLRGARGNRASLQGDINLMGARIAGSATFVDIEMVPPNGECAIHFKAARVEGDLNFHRVLVRGEINALSAHVA